MRFYTPWNPTFSQKICLAAYELFIKLEHIYGMAGMKEYFGSRAQLLDSKANLINFIVVNKFVYAGKTANQFPLVTDLSYSLEGFCYKKVIFINVM